MAKGKRVFPLLLSGEPLFAVSGLQYENVQDGGMPSPRWVGRLRAASRPVPLPSEHPVMDPAGGAAPASGPLASNDDNILSATAGLAGLWTPDGTLAGVWVEVVHTVAEVGRRDFLTLSGAALAGVGHEWLVAEPARLAAAVGGKRVDAALVADLHASVDVVRRLDDKLGGEAVYGVATEQLRLVVGLLRNNSFSEADGRGKTCASPSTVVKQRGSRSPTAALWMTASYWPRLFAWAASSRTSAILERSPTAVGAVVGWLHRRVFRGKAVSGVRGPGLAAVTDPAVAGRPLHAQTADQAGVGVA
jgi:hypothetical protein